MADDGEVDVAARKVLTRAESQAQTRQDLLDAAERLFYAGGYHATSIAAIAAEAGRTIGAVYSNFEGKEALCLEVLRLRFMAELTQLLSSLVAAGDSTDDRLAALAGWWARIGAEPNLVVLAAEYMTSTFHDPEQLAKSRDAIERFKESTRTLLEDALPEGVSPAHPMMDDAIEVAVATGTGVAIAQAMGNIDAARGADLVVVNLRTWFDAMALPEPAAPSRRRRRE